MSNLKESLDSDSFFKGADGFSSVFDGTLNSAEDFLTGEELTIEHIRSLSTTTPEAYRSVQQSESEENLYVEDEPLHSNDRYLESLKISTDHDGLTKHLRLEEPSRVAVGKSLDLSSSSDSNTAKLADGKTEYDSFSRSRRKKSNLPRVAMLASTPPKKPVAEKKNTPPPFRAGGKVVSNTTPAVRSPLSHRATPPQKRGTEVSPKGNMRESGGSLRSPGTKSTRSLSSSSKDYSVQGASSLSRRHTTGSSQTSPTRDGVVGSLRESGSTRRTREIAKPPENITRAIKESQELSKMEQENEQDLEIDHLRSLMDDIKELKSELGVPTEIGIAAGQGEAQDQGPKVDGPIHADYQDDKEQSPRKQPPDLQADDSMENRSSSSKDKDLVLPMKSPFAQDTEAELQVDNLTVEAGPVVEETTIPKKQLCGCCVM